MKRIVVVGSEGQDGKIVREQLAGDAITCVDRNIGADVLDAPAIAELIARTSPDELYYLAAHHHAAEDVPEPMPTLVRASLDVHVLGWTNTLEAIAAHAPKCRAFYASSSHVFGAPKTQPQNESTPFDPVNVYGVTKVAGMHVARLYRGRGVHASCGVLYNHESSHRGSAFLSQKLTRAARAKERVRLGDLDAIVDWGFADDTVRAMRAILTLDKADDFIVATGIPHTVRDFASAAFSAAGLDWREWVDVEPAVLHKPTHVLLGDASKLRAATGWSPSVTFEEMVYRFVR